MKKIFTLASALLLSVAMFAADRRPSVTVTSTKKYEIVIDGRSYLTSNGNAINISNIQAGRHTVKVFGVNKFFFMKGKKMISSTSFDLRNQDVAINIDRFGQLQVTETSYGRDHNNRGWNSKDDQGYGKGNRDDQGYGKGNKDDHGKFGHDKRF